MPRKVLGVRKEYVRLNAKGKPKPTYAIQVGCRVSPLFAYIHTPQRLASRTPWNKLIF